MTTTAERPAATANLGLSGYLAVAALFAAVLQTVSIALQPGVSGLTLMDDAVVVVLVASIFSRLGRAPGWTVYLIAVWVMLMVFGVINSIVGSGVTLILFRQVTIPALLILVGLTMTSYEWRIIARISIWIGIVNALYMALEYVGVRLLDPATLASYDRTHLVMRDGLPAYYYYYADSFGLGEIVRVGGLVLNPPIAGLVTGGALALLWYTPDFRYRRMWMILLTLTTAMTFGRGGILVAAFAIVVPAMIRKIGRMATVVLISPATYFIGTELADDGNSQIHAKGLTDGLRFALDGPFGLGFGATGNALKALGLTRSSESLLGIAFAAGGVVTVLILAGLIAKLFVSINRVGNWEAAVGIGVIIAALFSESAGALNGTIPLWMAIGVALRKAHEFRQTSTANLSP
ncbi:hypothetical protein O4160_25775 [Rhodococcus sp. IEGM 1401]|uniref:hypothetical protein n=1 Tax=unclassified Rhodococcus (in: high G+C Gram-positive bacteria) TaxID=192944 RepID=UPI0022B50BA1|nr:MULTISPECIES: hypothetical protein [unclassified Rhodococcus (in: high G+C Gram-positive bacteria)]MCZ4564250.1 hypothetical protein [Rhodococcus sp. IEGM 1401]MDI9924373.1 hypothetical protein [Rhodococcus sp. IEGM 1372]MDV8036831.1 hypothetical protein [Rhodococcus sp. IEGM 1414]